MKKINKYKVLIILNILLFLTIIILIPLIFINNSHSPKDIFSKAKNSVVELKAETEGKNTSYGSAIFINNSGELISNAHVISYTTKDETKIFDSFYIRFYKSEEYHSVSLIDYDIKKDICILKLEETKNISFTPIEFSSSTNLKEGDNVYAIGNTLNHGISITEGIISLPLINISYEDYKMKLIQCDLTIANGNSGGSLLNSNGNLIGMTTLRLKNQSGYIEYGIAYSIPSNDITDYLAIKNISYK